MSGGAATIDVGIVGLGKIAKGQHVPAIQASRLLTLRATADPAGGMQSVQHFRDIETLLADDAAPAAVAVCTPPQLRHRIARCALACGRHVLLEKPPCATLGEIEDLKDRAARAGLTLFCAWHSRFAPAVEPAKEWLSSHEPRRVRIDWREDVRVWHPNQAWIWQAGGFGAFDPGINALSVVTRILPRPLFVREASLRIPANCQAPASVELSLDDAENMEVRASFDFLENGPPTWTIEVETNDGNLRLSQGGRRLSINDDQVPLGPHEEYAALYEHFARLIAAGRSDADTTPLELVADAFLRGTVIAGPPLDESYGDLA